MKNITQAEFKQRRARLMEQMEPNSIGFLPAAAECLRNQDAHYLYRQDSDFYYLTGFNEPSAVAVFIPGRTDGEFILFNQENNQELATWIGPRVGQEGACQHYGAHQAYPIEKLHEIMPQLIQGKDILYFPMGVNSLWDQHVAGWLNQIRRRVRTGVSAPHTMRHIHHILHEMRLFKSDAEVDLMRQAAELSAEAHMLAMQRCQEVTHEYQVEAHMWHHLALNGCRSWAYTPIVGGGANACILHYIDNSASLKSGDLLLVDAGAECHYYAADITRTYPINGKFTVEQKAIYSLVLKAQKAGIESIKPGAPWNVMQKNILQVLTEGLIHLGILKGSVETLIAAEAYKPYYMHNSGHWLGLDVHDVGAYKIQNQWRPLEPGMVLTVEPGLYMSPRPDLDPKWWNIGVRIEDDVLVTDTGYDVLSASVMKEIDEIETFMAK